MTKGFQHDVAKLLLSRLDSYGFALSGGLALSELGLTNRPTKDIDLFTSSFDKDLFDKAVSEALATLQQTGYKAVLSRKTDTFARLEIDYSNECLSVDLGYDYREYDTVKTDIGYVANKKDVILNKVSALYARALPRDYIDVSNILMSGEMTGAELLRLSKERDEGFVPEFFIAALRKVWTFDYEDFCEYGISKEACDDMKITISAWADEIEKAQTV